MITKYVYTRNKGDVTGYNYLCLVDGSKKSFTALDLAVRLMTNKEEDSLMVLFCPKNHTL